MPEWKVKHTGKFIYLLVGFGIFILIYLLIAIRFSYSGDMTILESISSLAIMGFLFIIAWLTVFPGMILRKKIPLKIIADIDDSKIHFVFPKNKIATLNKDEFAWDLHTYKFYNCLVISKKIRSRRGHNVYVEQYSIIGLRNMPGWHYDKLMDVSEWLELNNYEKHIKKDKFLFQRLMN